MREISDHMLDFVKGGMNLNGLPSSTNVIDSTRKKIWEHILMLMEHAGLRVLHPSSCIRGEVDLLIV